MCLFIITMVHLINNNNNDKLYYFYKYQTLDGTYMMQISVRKKKNQFKTTTTT